LKFESNFDGQRGGKDRLKDQSLGEYRMGGKSIDWGQQGTEGGPLRTFHQSIYGETKNPGQASNSNLKQKKK